MIAKIGEALLVVLVLVLAARWIALILGPLVPVLIGALLLGWLLLAVIPRH